MSPDLLRDLVVRANYVPVEIPPSLGVSLSHVLDDSLLDWTLYEIPTHTEGDRQLLNLLSVMKCPAVTDFQPALDKPLREPGGRKSFDLESIDIGTMGGTESDLEWIEIRKNPGLFYQTLIPSDRISQRPQSWLFRNPKKTSE